MQPIAALFTLPEDQLPAVTRQGSAAGLPVEAWSRDSTTKIATGRLLTIDNQIDPNTGTFRCKAVFDNRDGALFPNQFVNARLQVESGVTRSPFRPRRCSTARRERTSTSSSRTRRVEMRPVQVAMTEGTTSVARQRRQRRRAGRHRRRRQTAAEGESRDRRRARRRSRAAGGADDGGAHKQGKP